MVLLLDVIEHLAEPEEFLLSLRNRSVATKAPYAAPVFVISTPNVAFAGIRLNLLFGRFNYAERGILDITHKRLFTRASLLSALDQCGYDVQRVRGSAIPFQAVVHGRWGRGIWQAERNCGARMAKHVCISVCGTLQAAGRA